jgi:hypothetical protein
MNRLEIAEVCYEAHRSYCHRLGESLPPWSSFPYRDRVAQSVDLCLAVPSSHLRDQSPELIRYVVSGWFDESPLTPKVYPPRRYVESLADRRKLALFVAITWSLAAAQ